MTVSPVGQGRVFLINILFGMLCVILFDFFWVLRRRYGKSIVIINAMDGIYFVIAFALVLFAGVKFNFGALRYYQIIGLFMGMGIQSLFSRLTRRILEKLYGFLVRIIKIFGKLIIKPNLFILRLVLSPLCFFENQAIRLSSKIHKKYNKVKLKRIKKKKTVKKRIKMI